MRTRTLRHILISLIACAALVIGLAACTGTDGGSADGDLLVRRDVKNLSTAEKKDFVDAIKKMKTTPAVNDGRVTNQYDAFVATHLSKLLCWSYDPDQGGWGHYGPDLVTWHRAYMLDFEDALAEAAGHRIAIPYWDWTNEESTAAVFTDDFMGSLGSEADGYAVTTGPFRKGEWTLEVLGVGSTDYSLPNYIVRAEGTSSDAPDLPDTDEVNQALLRESYDAAPWNSAADPNVSFRQFIDGGDATGLTCEGGQVTFQDVKAGSLRMHSTVHLWVGGVVNGVSGALANTATSPNDPVFWLHHANIDRIAEAWWSTHDYQYLPRTGGPLGNNADDKLYPFSYTNGDMAASTEGFGYVYEDLPSASGEAIVPVSHDGAKPTHHH